MRAMAGAGAVPAVCAAGQQSAAQSATAAAPARQITRRLVPPWLAASPLRSPEPRNRPVRQKTRLTGARVPPRRRSQRRTARTRDREGTRPPSVSGSEVLAPLHAAVSPQQSGRGRGPHTALRVPEARAGSLSGTGQGSSESSGPSRATPSPELSGYSAVSGHSGDGEGRRS